MKPHHFNEINVASNKLLKSFPLNPGPNLPDLLRLCMYNNQFEEPTPMSEISSTFSFSLKGPERLDGENQAGDRKAPEIQN